MMHSSNRKTVENETNIEFRSFVNAKISPKAQANVVLVHLVHTPLMPDAFWIVEGVWVAVYHMAEKDEIPNKNRWSPFS